MNNFLFVIHFYLLGLQSSTYFNRSNNTQCSTIHIYRINFIIIVYFFIIWLHFILTLIRSIFSENLKDSKYFLLFFSLSLSLLSPACQSSFTETKGSEIECQAAVSHSRQYPPLLAAPSRVGSGVYVARWADYVPRRADKPACKKTNGSPSRAVNEISTC